MKLEDDLLFKIFLQKLFFFIVERLSMTRLGDLLQLWDTF